MEYIRFENKESKSIIYTIMLVNMLANITFFNFHHLARSDRPQSHLKLELFWYWTRYAVTIFSKLIFFFLVMPKGGPSI